MAGDSDTAYLAHCFELNASKLQSTFDEIYRKYDRDFPDDDIIELRRAKIVHDRGILKSMPTRRMGSATFGKHVHVKADTHLYTSHSQLDQGNITGSPEASEKSFHSLSEKSFISVNCSRWANNIEEESEPSDAETIGDSEEDSDSWEDETEETDTLSGSEEERAVTRTAEADTSDDEEEWLTITEAGRWRRQHSHLPGKKTKHACAHTSSYDTTHKSAKQRGLAKYKKHSVHQYVSRHSRRRREVVEEAPHSGLTTEQNVKERLGPPRRVRLVTLLSQLQGNKDTADTFSQEPGLFMDVGTLCDEKSARKKVLPDSGDVTDPLPARSGSAVLSPSSQPFSMHGCDDVDFFLPSGSVGEVVQVGDDMFVEDGIPLLQDNTRCRWSDTRHSQNETCQTKPLSVSSPPMSRLGLESTFTISKSSPSTKMTTNDSRKQIPYEREVRTCNPANEKWPDTEGLKMKKQEVGVQQACKKSGAETPCLLVALERTGPGAPTCTHSYSSQSGGPQENAVTGQSLLSSSCDITVVKSADMPHVPYDTVRKEASMDGTSAENSLTVQTVDLEQRRVSLVEIQKKLDRLSALFNSSSTVISESHSTADKSKQSGESHTVVPDVELVSAAPPEKMEISPEPDVRKKSGLAILSPSEAHAAGVEDCHPCEMTTVSPRTGPLPNKTFTMAADETDCKNTRINNHPFSTSTLAPNTGSTSSVEVQVSPMHKEQDCQSKRKFLPVYKPFSSEEIQDILDMFDSQSVINFLKEKSIKHEVEFVKEDKKCIETPSGSSHSNNLINSESAGHSAETNPSDTAAQHALHQLPCKQEMSKCAECCQLPQDTIKMEGTGQEGPAALSGQCSLAEMSTPGHGVWKQCYACHDWKSCRGLPKVTEIKQGGEERQRGQCLLHASSPQDTGMLATPGQIFRQTIRTLNVPLTTPERDMSVQDHIKGKESQGSLEESKGNVDEQSSCKTDLRSALKHQTAKFAALFAELESECVCQATLVSSPKVGQKQTLSSESTHHSPFLRKEESPDSRTSLKPSCTFSSSADEPKTCCHITSDLIVHQHTSTRSTPVQQTDFANKTDSITVSDNCYHGCSVFSASGESPLSLLKKMDSMKSGSGEKGQPKVSSARGQRDEQLQRESIWSRATPQTGSCHPDDSQHKGKSSGSLHIAQQTHEEGQYRKMFETAYTATPSPLCRCSICSLASRPQVSERPIVTSVSPSYRTDVTPGVTLDQRDQYRTQKAGDESTCSVTYDSFSVTPQNQSVDPNQSTTPSKLLNRLQLSDQRSPLVKLNLTKNCNKLSQLALESPAKRDGGCTGQDHLNHDRPLRLGGQEDNGQQRGSPDTTSSTKPLRENLSWKIFKTKNSRSVPQKASEHSSSSNNRCSSPQDLTDSASVPKLQGSSERRMVRISSPQTRKMGSSTGSHLFSFYSDPSVSTGSSRPPFSFNSDSSTPGGSCKRSFQSDLEETSYGRQKEMSSTSSPLKRLRLDSIHGTSTPSKTGSGPARFVMDDSLSTIAGENSDLNSTLNSSDMGAADGPYSGSEEEDEVTLIPE